MNKDVKKLFRLASSERYICEKTGSNSFEVFTEDFKMKAAVSNLGVIFLSDTEDYEKVKLHKLRNFCNLIIKCHKVY